ncbi:hypothetical protein QBC44DRAFT_62341 [Cladorrhinum sp. PSN332]|nr:hypothetical protein QBC44DRAFT_62341 [Cladorrhinum sp. PSN332]
MRPAAWMTCSDGEHGSHGAHGESPKVTQTGPNRGVPQHTQKATPHRGVIRRDQTRNNVEYKRRSKARKHPATGRLFNLLGRARVPPQDVPGTCTLHKETGASRLLALRAAIPNGPRGRAKHKTQTTRHLLDSLKALFSPKRPHPYPPKIAEVSPCSLSTNEAAFREHGPSKDQACRRQVKLRQTQRSVEPAHPGGEGVDSETGKKKDTRHDTARPPR